MNATLLGLVTGLTLGLSMAFGGVVAFLVVLVFGAAGVAVGRYLDGRLDLSRFGAGSRERTPR
jgi:hypothetical protein